jgi:predicted nucleic acid-binding protein
MPAIDVVVDASVALKWFHSEGEEEADDARRLLSEHKSRRLALMILDLTSYEIGNALLRGRASATAAAAAAVLDALAVICPAVTPAPTELRLAADLAERHDLTLYDAAYAAVAQQRGAALATMDKQLLAAELGQRPGEILARLPDDD